MQKGIYLLVLKLNGIRCFDRDAQLHLSDNDRNWKRWTVILGDNGTGKTTLLRSLSVLQQKDTLPLQYSNGKTQVYQLQVSGKSKIAKSGMSSYAIEAQTNCNTSLLDFDLHYELNENMISYHISSEKNYANLKIFSYGANRFMSKNSITDSVTDNSLTLFDDEAKLINAEEWLLQLDYSAIKDSQIQEFAVKRRDQVKEILLKVLPDIEAIRFTEPTKENLKTTIEFLTPYGWVTIHQLSLGYKTMVAWMVDLAARMFERYPDSDNPLAEPAIVLVDEIDLHMHPKWQRKIFDYLSEKFPKTQFIVTAHSPLIVQSAPKDANIVLLRREGDHVVIDNDIQSVHNWRIDQILNSDLFGNISQLPPEEEAWMEERTKLIQKGKLNEMERKRLDELNKKAEELPTADNQRDIEAMQIIREAADYLKSKKTGTPA